MKQNINYSLFSVEHQENFLKSVSKLICKFNIIHSSFIGIGPPADGVENFLLRLIDTVGPNNLIMPAFSFGSKGNWSCAKTPSDCGIMTEIFRRQDNTLRTIHPVHSLSIMGPDAEFLSSFLSDTSFGEDSLWNFLLQSEDSVNLSFGIGLVGGATFLHCVEERAKVPYREIIDLDSEVVDCNGKDLKFQFRYFAHSQNSKGNNWKSVEADLRKNELLLEQEVHGINISAMKIMEVSNFVRDKLIKNPYYLSNK